MDPADGSRADCPANGGRRRPLWRHVACKALTAVLGVTAVVSSITAFQALKDGKQSNGSDSAASAAARHGFVSQAQMDLNARTFLCLSSLRTSYAAQIPTNLCTYLVYTDVYFNQRADSFSPVNEATLSAFENASLIGARVLAAVGSPLLPELAQSPSLVRRFGEAAVRWLVARAFRGLAFVNYRTTTDKLEELADVAEELQSMLGASRLEIALSVSLKDWQSPSALVATRLYSIAQHVNLLILQTHYFMEESKCKTGFPTIYTASKDEPQTVPITSALGWINALKEDFRVRASVCFSVSLGVYVFAGASKIPSECKTVRQRGYDMVCDGKQRERILPFSPHGGAAISRSNNELLSYEEASIGAKKVNAAVQRTPSACVAVFDVDMDDYEGICGAPFARLQSLLRAESLGEPAEEEMNRTTTATSSNEVEVHSPPRRCAARKGEQRPLLCILSERTDRKRTVSRQLCTHFVFSLRHMEYGAALRALSSELLEDFAGVDAPLLVALGEHALESVPSHELAHQTSAQLRRYGLHGLALLYVAVPLAKAATLLPALVVLHTTYKEDNLCLLFSAQVLADADDTAISVPSIKQIARFTDMFILNTHYPGYMGPCRVTAASTLHEDRKRCIPTLPLETAAEWLRQVEESSPQGPALFVSVDMRSFQYRVYQRPVLEASCNLEEHAEYSQVCNNTGWRALHVRATAATVKAKGNEVVSYETPESVKVAALTVRRAVQHGSVAVFNADFEDSRGGCLGTPYPRLTALRKALDSTDVGPPVTAEPNVGNRSRDLVPEEEDTPVARPLLCVVSEELYDDTQVPDRLCTHIVHRGLSVDLTEKTVFLSERSLRLAWSRKHARHLAALAGGGSSALVANLERSGPRMAAYVALQVAGFLRRHALHGLALLHLGRTTRELVKFAQIFHAMRTVLQPDLQIMLSVEIVDIQVPPKLLAQRLHDLVKEVDMLVFETHFYHNRGYCQKEAPSSFEAPRKAFTVAMRTALSWMEALNQNQSICLSVNLAVLQFTSVSDRPSCERRGDLSYSEICDSRDWKIMLSNLSDSMVRRKETIWQLYEEPKLLKDKVFKVIALQPAACVAAFNVDYEDYKPACGNSSFPRLTAIEEAYNQADGNSSDVRVLRNSLHEENAIQDIFRMTGFLNYRRRRPLGIKQILGHAEPGAHGNKTSANVTHRPFICFLSSSWSQLHALPRRHCTHYVFDPEGSDAPRTSPALNVSDIKEYVGAGKKFLMRIHPSFDESQATFIRIAKRITALGLDGVAIVEQKYFSTEFSTLAVFVRLLNRKLPPNSSVVLGVEIQDYDEDPAVIVQRLRSLFSVSEMVILQTHFKRSWAFCKTAYPSVYSDIGDGCSQTVPMKTALAWTRAATERGAACISVTMATQSFRVPGPRPVGTACLTSTEKRSVCTKGGSETQDDRYGAAYRYTDEEWLSYETEHLLAMKMRAARRSHPSFCVAVFNADYDVPGVNCSKKRAPPPFSRLDAIAGGAGYKKAKEDGRKAPDNKYIDVDDDREPPTLVCVVSDEKSDAPYLPEEGCDFLVYQSIVYKNNGTFTPRSNKTDFLKSFASTRTRDEDVKYLVALDAGEFVRHYANDVRDEEWFARFVGRLVLFLEENNMDGVAVVELPLSLAELDRATSSLAAIRRCTAHFGYVFLLGVTLRDAGNVTIAAALPRLVAISRLADVLVLESHLVAASTRAENGSCSVRFPSSAHASALGGRRGLSLDEAARFLRRLEHALAISSPSSSSDVDDEHEETEVQLCFSVSLAAFRFHVDGSAKGVPGLACKSADMVPFQETCASSQNVSWSSPKVSETERSSYRVAPGTVITFDTVNDIEHKLVATVRGLTCGAVYAVNFDEPESVCAVSAGIKTFPRFQAVVNSIAVASTADEDDGDQHEGETVDPATSSVVLVKARGARGTATTTESGTTHRPSSLSATTEAPEKRLICTVANGTNAVLSDVRKACSHLVFSSLSYDRNSSVLVPKDEVGLNAFLALKNSSVKLAVELDTADLLESAQNAETEQVAVATLFWMQKHGLESLALFVKRHDFSEAHLQRLISLIKMLRTSLRTVLTDQIKEVIVAVPLQSRAFISELLQYADTIVYITHHSAPSESCVVAFPSTFDSNQSFSDVERDDLVPASTRGAFRTQRFCVSVSLAVLRFVLDDSVSRVANSSCLHESWVSYDQTCLEGDAVTTYDADSMAVFIEGKGYALTFENEESLHLKARHISDLFGGKACVAAFHVEYDAGRNACSAELHAGSRLAELASALQDNAHATTQPAHEAILICILSEKPPSPIQLPQRMCTLTVYQHIFYDRTTDRVMPRDGASFHDFAELSKRDVSSRLVAAFDDLGFTVPWAHDRLYPGRFARSAAAWCRDYALHGVAFLPLNFSALQRVEPVVRALNNMSSVRPLVVLGMPRTDDLPTLNRVAPHVDVIVFLTHHTGPSKPCRVTVPSSRVMMIDSSIFMRQTAELTKQILRRHHNLASVCVASNLAVLRFSLPPKQSDLDDSCISEEQVNYAQVCTWQGNFEYDVVSSSMLSRKQNTVLTYENEYSLETKTRAYLSYSPRGCVAAFNADYEDARGTCREPFSRLAALDKVLGQKNHSRTLGSPRPLRGTLVCIPSSTYRPRADFPFSHCDFFVDGEVEYLYNNIVKTSSYKANLRGQLLDAKLNWTCFVVSLDAGKVLDNLQDTESARKKIISFLTNWLSTEGLCGLAVKEPARTQPVKNLDKFLQELSEEFIERKPRPVLILLASAFEHESRLSELSKYSDLLVLTNDVPNESKDCKLRGTMTAATDVEMKLAMSRLLELSGALASNGGVCFSTTLAVYKYRLHQGLHGAGESCRRMAETTFGEACPPEESSRSVEVASMTSYTYDKSHMLAFEDERSLRIKMDTFLSRYQRGCVAVFGADMDTAASNCSGVQHFARLKALRMLLGTTGSRWALDVADQVKTTSWEIIK